ncbi:carboxypeptidase O-like [Drosophila biarmipes]|uniref:carboxypeptidase O-like n=1 Tax=Drosophila biarmipes TaxID=125945 RepID=UPI0007E64DC3|nr:carboxypeptidase O-like [Drosophila biarmipes]
MDAAIQGNEWITTTVALKTIHELVVNCEANKMLLERFDWYILPMANPDGYEYSWNTMFQDWKKNRSPNGLHVGTNLNRNFDTKRNKLDKWHRLTSSQETPLKDVEVFESIANYVSERIFLETKPVFLRIPPKEYERSGGSSLDYAFEQGFPLTYGLEVFESLANPEFSGGA